MCLKLHSCSNAIGEPFLVLQRRLFNDPSLSYLFIISRTFYRNKKPIVKQKDSSDVIVYLWNHLGKKLYFRFLYKSIFTKQILYKKRYFNDQGLLTS